MELKIIPIGEFLGKDYLNFPIPSEQETLKNFQESLDAYKIAYGIAYNKQESEEHFKGIFNNFIKNSFSYTVNTHERIDSCIFDKDGAINTLIEVKRPFNTNEMITEDNPNKKAFHEALLYFYEQSQTSLFVHINNIFITDCQNLYVFKASAFKTLIEDKNISKILKGFKDKSLDLIKTTGDLYNALSPACENISLEGFKIDLLGESLDIRHLYKLLEKHYLFRLPLENDANSLNKDFYNELLYIMGLEENSKDHTLSKSKDKNTFLDLSQEMLKGNIPDKDIFETALGLNILWLNRILFLKILESQLQIFRNDAAFTILSPNKIKGYHLLSKLFFNILSTPREDRHEDDKNPYELIPYLNSSLFEKTELEKTYGIDKLDAEHLLPIMPGSILYNDNTFSKKKLTLLEYLLRFLNCFHFNNDAESEDNNTVIKSSVLGLVFEKLNGYKDGSHFTPASITMYMARQTIQQQAVHKFNEAFGIEAADFDELISFTSKFYKPEDIEKAHHIIDGISIIDPAVGSGHFLVSCLNELIVIKGQLGLLHRGIKAECINDELILKNSYGDRFLYQMQNKTITPEKQEIQKALFDTKKHIIENQLYGIDINPNSVNICRLRLWIELLKHTYFTDNSFLDCEVLPNLEFKVMAADSLLPLENRTQSRYITSNEFNNKKSELTRRFSEYYNARGSDKEAMKQSIRETLKSMKGMAHFTPDDKQGELLQAFEPFNISVSAGFFDAPFMFGRDRFDIVIMNPPYFGLTKNHPYQSFMKTGDIYQLFIERAEDLIVDKNGNSDGIVSAVVSNKWMRADYGARTRGWLKSRLVHEVIDLGSGWFDSATVDTCIITYGLNKAGGTSPAWILSSKYKSAGIALGKADQPALSISLKDIVGEDPWLILTERERSILNKMKTQAKILKEWDITINYGIKTGFNEAFIIDGATKDALIAEDSRSAEIIKPLLKDDTISRYAINFDDRYLINVHNGVKNLNIAPLNIKNYPTIKNHIDSIIKLVERGDIKRRGGHTGANKKFHERSDQGITSYNLRDCSYLQNFEKPKIIWKQTAILQTFTYDNDGYFLDVSGQMLIHNKDSKQKLKYILAVLNSPLVNFYMKRSATAFGEKGTRWIPSFIESIPIPVPSPQQEAQITGLVQTILDKKTENIDTSPEERQIDQLVYRLYGLTEEEIGIVEA